MSIALSIQPRGTPTEEARLVPIATQDDFKSYWLPACDSLKLIWIPMFETGLPLRLEDIQDVLAELHKLKTWIEKHSPESSAVISSRIDRLISELSSIEGRRDVEAYVG